MLSSEVVISREQATKNLCHCPVCEKARASTEGDPNVDSLQFHPHLNGQDGSIQPSFDTLTIICHQIVENYPQPLTSVLHDDITPTRIEDGSLWIVLCHHVNGINVTESLRQGNVTSSMIECMTIQTQFPNVPQHQRRLLIEHSLEMAAYRDIVRRMRGNHSLKGQLDTTLAYFRQQDREQEGVDRMLTFEDFAFEEVDDIDDDPCC
ncbi:hypothetical protein BGZ72_008058 [Mortierella alpina]|nr:hypothetical protein BGZ72_008058 [Mortierella alpina]